MGDERRKSPRIKLDKPLSARVRMYVAGQVLDVSADGLLMRVRKMLSPGTACALRLAFPDGDAEVCGTVRRSWLAGFETDEDGDRVRAYDAAVEFEKPAPELVGRFRPGQDLKVHMQGDAGGAPEG